ncbi:MAG TPA: hypothetical protein DEA97_03355 [Bacteroidales bacterium]|nr:hypothetical protein [Bacteroidales bacterium]
MKILIVLISLSCFLVASYSTIASKTTSSTYKVTIIDKDKIDKDKIDKDKKDKKDKKVSKKNKKGCCPEGTTCDPSKCSGKCDPSKCAGQCDPSKCTGKCDATKNAGKCDATKCKTGTTGSTGCGSHK